jgi:hypothetical protein
VSIAAAKGEARPAQEPLASDPLHFTLVHDGEGLQRWQWACATALLDSGEARLSRIEPRAAEGRGPQSSLSQRLYTRAVTAGLDLFDVIRPDAQQCAVRSDFVLDFSTSGTDIANAPLGIWRVHLGDAGQGELPAGREAAAGSLLVTVAVVARSATGEAVVHSATIKTRRSQRATLIAMLNAAREVCLGAVRRVRDRWPEFPATHSEVNTSPAPTMPAIITGQTRRAVRRARDIVLFEDIWALGVIHRPVGELLKPGALPEPSWHPVRNDGEFHADPFPLWAGGREAVLFERFDPVQRRGLIAATWLVDWATTGPQRTAIDLGCHMSYPTVFHHQGKTYCAPETHVLGGLRIFVMGSDPWDWTPVAHVLPDLPLIDATLAEHDGLWWLLGTLGGAASDTDLHAWHAPAPFGPWTAHRLNPVKSDIRSSRPAGGLFRLSDGLYRPAQDCVDGYGSAVVINKILRLDKGNFMEAPVKRIVPEAHWAFPDGLHTFSVFDDRVVIDAKRRTLRARSAASRFIPGRAGKGIFKF